MQGFKGIVCSPQTNILLFFLRATGAGRRLSRAYALRIVCFVISLHICSGPLNRPELFLILYTPPRTQHIRHLMTLAVGFCSTLDSTCKNSPGEVWSRNKYQQKYVRKYYSSPEEPALSINNFPSPRYPAPNFTLPDLQGNATTLSNYQGSVVLIMFWTTW